MHLALESLRQMGHSGNVQVPSLMGFYAFLHPYASRYLFLSIVGNSFKEQGL